MNTAEPLPRPSRLNSYARLMRLDRPIGMLLLMWPTLWALWVAGAGHPSWNNLSIFVCGVAIMRAAGCVMNDIADRDFDAHVRRTRDRPLAAGEVGVTEALVLFAVLLAAAFGLVLLTNALTIELAFAGAALAASYPFFKRFTHLPQLALGVAFSWGIPMAFAAETGSVPVAAWWLAAANILYVAIYDTLYAMVDREDDLAIGVKSTAILLGQYDLLALRVLCLAFVGLLAWFGARMGLGWAWFAGLVVAAGLFAWQQVQVRGRERSACFRAFLNNNWVGLAVFAGLVGNYLLS